MTNPGYQEYMFPILKFLYDKELTYKKDIFEGMKTAFAFTPEIMEDMLPSQAEPKYINRIGWALTYLKKAGLISSPTRANYVITDEGKIIVDKNIIDLDPKYLKRYDSFREFTNAPKKPFVLDEKESDVEEVETPEELLIKNFEIIKKNVCDDLLNKILDQTPAFFEQLVVNLIVSMGYGGSVEDAGKATKLTNDGGIDGLVKEDKLGLDTIYIQAKRWHKENTVSRPELQKFIGALSEFGTRKGIFITTSSFTKGAKEVKPRNDTNIVLIDGSKLVELMYEFNIGTTTEKKFEIKRMDSDYFDKI